jgi:hypothetical protein
MATQHRGTSDKNDKALSEYLSCVITPMTNGDHGPEFRFVHVIDATIVGFIVFFSVLLGQSVSTVFTGGTIYIGFEEAIDRLLTAAIGFGLTFFMQWARYRGIEILGGNNE